MNWQTIIQDLLDAGMTQAQIAESCETGQSHISGLYRGTRKEPGYGLGTRLVKLYARRCRNAAQPDRRTDAEPGHVMAERRKEAS